MPREIKTPKRYQTEPDQGEYIRTGKRGRPRLLKNASKYEVAAAKKATQEATAKKTLSEGATKKTPSEVANKKAPPEPIIHLDDDSDVEIVDQPSPPSKKKKIDEDPDWGYEKKSSAARSKTKNREKAIKISATASTPALVTEPVKKAEVPKIPVTTVVKKSQPATPSSFVELFMECKDEPLSQAQ
ncbi:hypothetical protein BgiMline_036236, partial [Biomphalaria glabrata]